ncbi:MAG: substrate-binding domain-containing protein, partial [Flavobacterium sp.]|nr:substrate-binding domain-containing protein [Flavobacterium sp.]
MSYIRLLLLIIVLVGCDNKKAKDGETILKGKTSIIVDESLLPIIQDQIMVFEGDYDAKITATPRSEKEAIRAFSSDTAKIVILARDLTAQELKLFNQKAINPVRTKFATDAIVFIANKQSRDSV